MEMDNINLYAEYTKETNGDIYTCSKEREYTFEFVEWLKTKALFALHISQKSELCAAQIVLAIVEDLKDRAGLQNAWEQIDENTLAEVLNDWQKIVLKQILFL
jgi:acyl-CoA-binding protein